MLARCNAAPPHSCVCLSHPAAAAGRPARSAVAFSRTKARVKRLECVMKPPPHHPHPPPPPSHAHTLLMDCNWLQGLQSINHPGKLDYFLFIYFFSKTLIFPPSDVLMKTNEVCECVCGSPAVLGLKYKGTNFSWLCSNFEHCTCVALQMKVPIFYPHPDL